MTQVVSKWDWGKSMNMRMGWCLQRGETGVEGSQVLHIGAQHGMRRGCV
jgi:hypothetical protein